jgi:alpha-mannosidase
VSPGNVVVSAVKKAEKDDGIIIRLIEMAGKRTTAKIKFDKTGFGILSSAKETDLMERPMKDGSAKLPAKDTVSVRIPGKEFATVLVKTRKKK